MLADELEKQRRKSTVDEQRAMNLDELNRKKAEDDKEIILLREEIEK